MARIKTKRTAKITLMLAPETIDYLVQLGSHRAVGSVSEITDLVINEYRSFFSKGDNSSNQETEVNQTTDLQPA